MKTSRNPPHALAIAAAISSAAASLAAAQTIVNGGFESGLSGWTAADQVGSSGSFFLQSGAASPINSFVVPAPPGGIRAAMTDSTAGGSHVLYQDFFVPAVVSPGTKVSFALYLNNAATTYFNPGNLDWALTNASGQLNLNQQARIDITTAAPDPFGVGPDVLLNLFQTDATTPPILGYSQFQIDITALLQAHAGETLRIRFAETDNVNFFNMGVDDVKIVPAPSAFLLLGGGLAASSAGRRRSRAGR
jgi:hypothetical protein